MQEFLRRFLLIIQSIFLVVVLANPSVTGLAFEKQKLVTLSGKVSDCIKNREQLLPGVKAYLFKDTLLIDSVLISPYGSFAFDSLREGTYDIAIRGGEYFPLKIVGVKIEHKDTLVKIEAEPKSIYVLNERFKTEEISKRKVFAYFKPIISEQEIENRVVNHYGYKIQAVGTEFRGTVKFSRLKTIDGAEIISCSILIPVGETPTGVANKIVMDPFLHEVLPLAGVGSGRYKVLERKFK